MSFRAFVIFSGDENTAPSIPRYNKMGNVVLDNNKLNNKELDNNKLNNKELDNISVTTSTITKKLDNKNKMLNPLPHFTPEQMLVASASKKKTMISQKLAPMTR